MFGDGNHAKGALKLKEEIIHLRNDRIEVTEKLNMTIDKNNRLQRVRSLLFS